MHSSEFQLQGKCAYSRCISARGHIERRRGCGGADIGEVNNILYTVYNMQYKKHKIPNTGYGILNTEYGIRNTYRASRGFTLVELIVSIGLFAIVMLISVGALLALTGANRKAQALQSVMNNLNVALD